MLKYKQAKKDEKRREILLLMYFNQLSIKEIAEVLEIPEGTVKSRLVSAKTALKRKMELSEDVEQFKIFLPLPLLLFTAMRKDFSMLMHARPHTSYLSFARSEPHIIMTAASLVAISAVGGGIGVSMISNTNDAIVQSNAATYTDTTGTYTQKEVYYKLREWAHCHVEMEQKTSAEFQEILPYYSFLKELNSPYYIKLKAYNHWAEDFEKNLK